MLKQDIVDQQGEGKETERIKMEMRQAVMQVENYKEQQEKSETIIRNLQDSLKSYQNQQSNSNKDYEIQDLKLKISDLEYELENSLSKFDRQVFEITELRQKIKKLESSSKASTSRIDFSSLKRYSDSATKISAF